MNQENIVSGNGMREHTAASQKEFFNQKACQWDTMCQHNPEKIERIISILDIRGNENILDVGTGTGVLIPFYERRLSSGKVVAFDFSENMIEVARNKFPRENHPAVEFRVEDLYETRYASEFHIIMCYSCFPHFHDKGRALRLLARALRPGGRFIVAHTEPRETINGVHRETDPVVSRDLLPPIHDLKHMAAEAGMKPVYELDDTEYYIMMAEKV